MKKTLLLSVVASTMIMAGGDIAPVEPVVEVVEVSPWNFTGESVAYMQTRDLAGRGDLFGGDETAGGLGLQLGVTNADIFAGIGFGAKVAAIGSGNDNGFSNSNFCMQTGYGLTEGYLTYGMDSISTSLKVGRQTLPKSLSPFAFSEGWQMFKNTFDAALLVNTSLPNTALVYAFVNKSNGSVNNLPTAAGWKNGYEDIGSFYHINPSKDGVNMLTVQNKSIENLSLTGTWYYAANYTEALANGGDVNILWGDATYAADAFTVGIQGGQVDPDGLSSTSAFGAKIAGNLGMFSLLAAYSSVDDGAVPIVNLGTDVKTPLYTQSILDQDTISLDADTFKLAAGMKALGGKFGLAYMNADLGNGSRGAVMYSGADRVNASGTYEEIDFTYKTKVGENTTLFAGYVFQSDDRYNDEDQNFVRFWARYNFN